ncbi:hypothetical protein [Sphingosinicella sp. BN140058]|uniref:hypothetical protein n=1 Tax=Sphingosinicella sp. BN140058 TaxID=1892855 RepID=UPI0013EA36A8|nr:hypothetical protein [Sphingosinicella sp. BN140058]
MASSSTINTFIKTSDLKTLSRSVRPNIDQEFRTALARRCSCALPFLQLFLMLGGETFHKDLDQHSDALATETATENPTGICFLARRRQPGDAGRQYLGRPSPVPRAPPAAACISPVLSGGRTNGQHAHQHPRLTRQATLMDKATMLRSSG